MNPILKFSVQLAKCDVEKCILFLLGPTTLSKYFGKPSVHPCLWITSHTFLFEILFDKRSSRVFFLETTVDTRSEIKHLFNTLTHLDQRLQHEKTNKTLISSITKFWFRTWSSRCVECRVAQLNVLDVSQQHSEIKPWAYTQAYSRTKIHHGSFCYFSVSDACCTTKVTHT